MTSAVFIDRDGVLVEDIGPLTDSANLSLINGAAQALGMLHEAGFFLVLASNQTVIARGLATEEDVRMLNLRLDALLRAAGGVTLDAHYFCPHHPEATVPRYRVVCDCRKPRPGLLHDAAREHDLKLSDSFMIGDRLTDVAAGTAAGCQTVLVHSGRHKDPPIITLEPVATNLQPTHVATDLRMAAEWVIRESGQ